VRDVGEFEEWEVGLPGAIPLFTAPMGRRQYLPGHCIRNVERAVVALRSGSARGYSAIANRSAKGYPGMCFGRTARTLICNNLSLILARWEAGTDREL
jgi:hypothetical protein